MAATTTRPKGPTGERGAVAQPVGGLRGWSAFIDEAEYVPELAWPASIPTYHRMRSDSQVEALHLGTTQPVREFRWSIDVNGAPGAIAEQIAGDLGLPLRGHEEDHVPRSASRFVFDEFLSDALLAPLYGFFDFEIVGELNAPRTEWHIGGLAPRHPRTIAEFQTTSTGELVAIRQNIAGAGGPLAMPPPIPANALLRFIWRREAGSHVGRSMLRSLYREWLVKDRTIRVAAINLERAGGMPVIEGPQGASDPQLAQLATMARQFKVSEGGGGAIPFGTKLHLAGGNAPDAIALLEYCDQAMARVWALMLLQLGTTATGSRALGSEFSTFAARAHRAMAKWIVTTVNRLLDDYVEYNLGGDPRFAPRLYFEQAHPDALSTDELVALITAGALTVDPELEAWIRGERGLPARVMTDSGDPDLGELTPEEVALVQGARNPPPVPPPGTAAPDAPAPAPEPGSVAARGPRRPREVAAAIASTVPLPDRTLRRQPYDVEVQAAVDFRALEAAHVDLAERAAGLFVDRVIPGQIEALGEQVTTTRAGTPRVRLTRSAMAALSAPTAGGDELEALLTLAARDGVRSALEELVAQGVDVAVEVPAEEVLAALVREQASAVSVMAANGLSLAAQRKATSLVGGGRSPGELATELRGHLAAMKHAWTADQLRGAVTMAQNAGRVHVFEQAEAAGAPSPRYYASELLDANCCMPCTQVDGTEYPSLMAAQQDYAAGGFVECAGGPRCRGTLVATYAEQDPLSSSNPVLDRATGLPVGV